MSKLKPTPGNLLIQLSKLEKKDDKGVIRPNRTGKNKWGEVVAVGDNDEFSGNIPYKKGDIVLLPATGFQVVKEDGVEYLLTHHTEIKLKK